MNLKKEYPSRIRILIHLVKYNPTTKNDKILGRKYITVHGVTKGDLNNIYNWIQETLKEKIKGRR